MFEAVTDGATWAAKIAQGRGRSARMRPSLARLITAKLDAKYAAGRTIDKITNPPIT